MIGVIDQVLEVLGGGIFREKGLPEYGRQDLGYSPGGALDLFSLSSGNILLGNDASAPGLEIVVPPRLRFRENCCFVFTGGRWEAVLTDSRGGDLQPVEHARVYQAHPGSVLEFRRRVYGFRTYLCWRKTPRRAGRIVGRRRGPFREVCRWLDAEGRIRVIPGPEYRCLSDPESFFETRWQISVDSSDMGLRLRSPRRFPGETGMISAPVNDGTIQLSPDGPVVLLRDRQTVGGYPRILNVISADLDLLAQYGPLEYLRFQPTNLQEAGEAARIKRRDLKRLHRRFR